MNPSSTSNSRTLTSLPMPTRAGFGALVLFLIVRLGFMVVPDPLYPLATDSFQVIQADAETRYRGEYHQPKVLLLGTSRLMGIDPELVAGSLGLNPGDVSNYSREGANFFRIHSFLKRNLEIVEDLHVLVIDLVPAQLYSPEWSVEHSSGFLRRASMEEKIRIRGMRGKVLALMDATIPFRTMRYAPQEWRIGLLGSDEDILTFNRDRRRILERDFAKGLAPVDKSSIMQRVVRDEFPPPPPLATQNFALHEILNLLPEHVELLLIRWPYREDARDFIDSTDELRESNDSFRRYVNELDREHVTTVWFERASDLGLLQEEFNEDGAHLSPSGLRKAADEISAIVRSEDWLEKE